MGVVETTGCRIRMVTGATLAVTGTRSECHDPVVKDHAGGRRFGAPTTTWRGPRAVSHKCEEFG
jgi:hypothetical protein